MGNRAVVTFASGDAIARYIKGDAEIEGAKKLEGFVAANPNRVGVYLHWNGGYDSVKPFCMACKRLGFRGAVTDNYGVACFTQLVRNFHGLDGLSVGVNTLNRLDTDNYDNGVFVVDDEWNIIGREFARSEQTNTEEFYGDFADRLVKMMKGAENAREEAFKVSEEA
jgi:hypothetical protein